jgi:C-8 sterol isomerase
MASRKSSIAANSGKIYLASFIVLIWASVAGIYNLIDTGIFDRHYIFTPEKLHALALTSIEAHGNDTRALVANIVSTLRADESIAPYMSTKEEWMFNNAGGAMGAMYLIHASKLRPYIPRAQHVSNNSQA